mmetsp:Transcript_77890/g.225274  ORF Transcript_77890/g.225274 Transcript_77890/m.225274 type:complete len:902 (-) Transcript_77890:92-2797(-)
MAKAVVAGIDLGAADSYVAFVGKGIVDIVQNEVSKRATPTIVAFTEKERLMGDAALALIRSNAKNTCRNFKHLLGRKLEAPDLKLEHFWSTAKLCECEDGHAGYEVTYKGETRKISAVEVTAMFLTQLREITEKWCEGKLTECVIAVPSAYADAQRQALLDAARIANIKVLRVMNEHTATALAYGIYRSNDFDPDKPMTVAFCSMGHSLFSVTVVQFVRGRLTVVCEKSDKVGGRELDECLMRAFAAQFEKKNGCDPLSNKKSAFKLEDAVMKTKKILSANSEAPVNVECLMEDADFASQMTRDDLESMCAPAMARVKAVLESALAASKLTPEQIDSVEIVGGSSRVPWVKKLCSEVLGGKQLSTTMNQEESVARGCALQAAILSPLYKVRDFKVEDSSPHAISIGWMGSAPPPDAAKEEDGDATMGADVEGEWKSSVVFPAGSPINVLKTLTFYRKSAFEIKAEYADMSTLLPMTPKELGSFKIEVPTMAEAKKVKVRAKLTLHGIFQIEGAQLVEEEEYEEVIKEKRELPPDDDEADNNAEQKPSPTAGEGEEVKEPQPTNGEAKKEAKKDEEAEAPAEDGADQPASPKPASPEPKADGEQVEDNPKKKRKQEPKFEWVEVKKTKRRTKKTDLKVVASGTPGLDDATIGRLMDAETAMQREMRDIIETDARRNDLESYIFTMRDKVGEGREYGEFISSDDREAFISELTKAEDWLYDNPEATKVMYIDKIDELKRIGDAVAWRCKEAGMRTEWIQAVEGTLTNYRSAAESPGDKFGHIAAEKLANIVTACNELEDWLTGMKEKQNKMPKYEKPVLICAEMERRNQELARMADEILREPKPAPPKEEPPAKEEGDASEKDADVGSAGGSPAAEGEAEKPEGTAEKTEEAPENGAADMEVD